MSKFRVGDVCEIIGGEGKFRGRECTVDSDLRPHLSDGTMVHYISIHDMPSWWHTGQWAAEPHELRLKRPPSWDRWIYDTSDITTDKEVVA